VTGPDPGGERHRSNSEEQESHHDLDERDPVRTGDM
jgi:hypothetical protein